MDEEINIIDTATRNEKIKNFFIKYKKKLIYFLVTFTFLIISYFAYEEYKNNKKDEISDLYNSVTIEHSNKNTEKVVNSLIYIINQKDPTYSPLSLYFIIDNSLIIEERKVNELFDIIIEKTSLDEEIKNLIILKKGLYNADNSTEKQMLDILKPLINSKSIWKSQALYLMAEYFFAKNEKVKSKEFYNQILLLENINQDIKIETQKRLNRDLSE
mgnify:CR=1 FL=1